MLPERQQSLGRQLQPNRLYVALSLVLVGSCAPRRCVDVLDVTTCFDDGRVARVERRLPKVQQPAFGWRCEGAGEARRCEDRAQNAGPFSCEGSRCIERYPRLPDDGQWECIDVDGAVLCRGGQAPAGIVAGPADLGWRCGVRRGHSSERLCLDFAPDLPGGATRGWRCRFEHVPTERRICMKEPEAPHLAARCPPGCSADARCIDGRCLPERMDPDCFFDEDCGQGRRCRLGACQ
jgi:hypothetical protein